MGSATFWYKSVRWGAVIRENNKLAEEYRARAEELLKKAESTPDPVRQHYLSLAQNWMRLADQVGKRSG